MESTLFAQVYETGLHRVNATQMPQAPQPVCSAKAVVQTTSTRSLTRSSEGLLARGKLRLHPWQSDHLALHPPRFATLRDAGGFQQLEDTDSELDMQQPTEFKPDETSSPAKGDVDVVHVKPPHVSHTREVQMPKQESTEIRSKLGVSPLEPAITLARPSSSSPETPSWPLGACFHRACHPRGLHPSDATRAHRGATAAQSLLAAAACPALSLPTRMIRCSSIAPPPTHTLGGADSPRGGALALRHRAVLTPLCVVHLQRVLSVVHKQSL